MPSQNGYKLPGMKSFDEFQDISRDALAIKWDSPNLQIVGRNGQDQGGIDILGPNDLGVSTGIQCRNTKKLDYVELEILADEAETEHGISEYWVAWSGERDANILKDIRLISEKRIKAGKIPMGIFFYQDLTDEILNEKAVFDKYFPELATRNQSIAKLTKTMSTKQKIVISNEKTAQLLNRLPIIHNNDLPKWPDIDWHEVCTFTALGFSGYKNILDEHMKKYGAYIDDKFKKYIDAMTGFCNQGERCVQMTDDGPQVSDEGVEYGAKLVKKMGTAANYAREFIKNMAE